MLIVGNLSIFYIQKTELIWLLTQLLSSFQALKRNFKFKDKLINYLNLSYLKLNFNTIVQVNVHINPQSVIMIIVGNLSIFYIKKIELVWLLA